MALKSSISGGQPKGLSMPKKEKEEHDNFSYTQRYHLKMASLIVMGLGDFRTHEEATVFLAGMFAGTHANSNAVEWLDQSFPRETKNALLKMLFSMEDFLKTMKEREAVDA